MDTTIDANPMIQTNSMASSILKFKSPIPPRLYGTGFCDLGTWVPCSCTSIHESKKSLVNSHSSGYINIFPPNPDESSTYINVCLLCIYIIHIL